MTAVRTFLVALLALSVAALPVAGAMARASTLQTTLHQANDPHGGEPHDSMAHGHAMGLDGMAASGEHDCCPHAKPCDHKPGDCGSNALCALKCFSFSGAFVTPARLMTLRASSVKTGPDNPVVASRSDNPPLPPPRV
jgi:hypothetical protein